MHVGFDEGPPSASAKAMISGKVTRVTSAQYTTRAGSSQFLQTLARLRNCSSLCFLRFRVRTRASSGSGVTGIAAILHASWIISRAISGGNDDAGTADNLGIERILKRKKAGCQNMSFGNVSGLTYAQVLVGEIQGVVAAAQAFKACVALESKRERTTFTP